MIHICGLGNMKKRALLTGGIFLLATCVGGMAQTTKTTVPSVVVAKIGSQIIKNKKTYIGRVEAVHTVALQARVDGFLEKKNFEEGGFVKKGQVLFQIEKEPYQASVDKAQAQLDGAQATAENSALNLKRQQILVKQDDVSQATVDEAVATLAADKALVGEAKADLETAKIDLGYTDVVSPIDGRISKTSVNTGNVVGTTSGALATITSIDPIYVSFFIDEKTLLEEKKQGLIKEAASTLKINIALADGTIYDKVGQISYVGTEVDATSDTIELRGTFTNADSILIPGQFVTVRLVDPNAKPVVTVPQTAIQLDSKGHFVFVVGSDDKVARRDVVLGEQLAQSWVVKSGLKEGESVVTQGLQKVHDGATVKPVSSQS